MKICKLDACYQCRYCSFDGDLPFTIEGYCHKKDDELILNTDTIPEWCPLEDWKEK